MESCGCSQCTQQYCSKKVSIFQGLNIEYLSKISSKVNHKTFKKGEVIFMQGDTTQNLYIVNSGKIKIFKDTPSGKEQILYILSDGDTIGELSLLKKETINYSAVAMEKTRVCVLTGHHFQEVITQNPDIIVKVMETVGDRLQKVESLVQSLGTKDVEARLAQTLASLAEEFGTVNNSGIKLTLPMSREELSNYVGVARETISRKLGVLQDAGLIELISNKKIIIKDLEKLKKHSSQE
ncbi:Crp/Fnr family transcriptional regulator [Proteinivorax hydrogeniformans]|uniref:Crp/Fnr family transcriptional regulator n=1 Tax=Proteinivorax hydrogeniformans TaxID=1826727 RepID=A0AAU8HW00_9FIRM